MPEIDIIPSSETGKLNVMHLKRYWNKAILKREGLLKQDSFIDEWQTDVTMLKALGLGLEQTVKCVYRQDLSFDEFESWIMEVTGGPDEEKIRQFNSLITGETFNQEPNSGDEALLTEADHDFWNENGYIIIKNAVSREDCDETIAALCDFMDRYDKTTWYNNHPSKQGIMVQMFQHPALEKNRNAPKIQKAFRELWGRNDIWVNADRVGFNPPETEQYKFPGPHLHWDVSITQPIPFGTQGVLYLADTAENQGAFTLVPGFQNKIGQWLESLPGGTNPRQQNIYALGAKPIAANAGDFILWHQALPHGSSPNTSALPRFVQYINYEPSDHKESRVWL
jgi:ectoine hydroxylase-related dioxygenase (phytanoyl-CoA dioxygenase family)